MQVLSEIIRLQVPAPYFEKNGDIVKKKQYTKNKFDLSLFQNPTSWYRGVPFWAWNCLVDEKKINRDVAIFHQMGFGGADIHCRYGLQNEYLSDEYMELVQKAEASLSDQGMLTWLYDEDRWPSGGAGGLIARPENASRCLLFTPVLRGREFCETIEEFQVKQQQGEDPDGYFLGQYEVLLDHGYLKKYARCEKEATKSFDGEMWYAYLALERNDIWYSGFGYVDTLNPRVVREFRDVTYERYKEVCGDKFGESIPAIFTDEPQFAYKETLAFPNEKKDIHLSYTDDLDEEFQKSYGDSLLDYLPELIWELPNGQISLHRYHYHDFVAERFSESYFGQLYQWCEQNGILLTGHAVEESTLWSQTRAIGEAMRCYHNLHIPGIDILCNAREYTTAKQAQSVSRQDGRDGVMSELYGVTNWDYTFRGHKIQGDWQVAMGISHRVLSLSLMSMEGASKRDFPASLSYQVPWYKEYKQIEDYFARVNTTMSAGKSIVRIGVIHPIESYWLHWGPMLQTAVIRDEMEEHFKQLIEWLVFGLMDFDFISENLLPKQYKGSEKGFEVGEMCYDVIIVPACETLRSTTLKYLCEFAENGGKILFLEQAGNYVDAKPNEAIKKLADCCEMIPFSKVSVLEALDSVREVDVIVRNSGRRAKDMLYQLRVEEDRRFLFLCNVTEQEAPNFFDIADGGLPCQQCDVILNGLYDVICLNPMTGESFHIEYNHANGKTYLPEEIYAAQSKLYLLTRVQEEKHTQLMFSREEPVMVEELKPMGYSLAEPNVLLLDMPEYAINDGSWRKKEEILRIQKIVNEELNYYKGYAQPWADSRPDTRDDKLSLRFRIFSEVEKPWVNLGIEHPEYSTIYWNGKKITALSSGWYVDEAIETVILGTLNKGDNELLIEMQIGPKTYIEPFYLLGDFGVNVMGQETVITKMPQCLYFGDIKDQGLAFYSGNLTYHCQYISDGDTCRLLCHDFSAPLLKVSVDGKEIGNIISAPYEVNLGILPAGTRDIDIVVFGNRYNTFGPLHNSDDNYQWYGECAWETQGAFFSYEYHRKIFGILTSPRILK